MWQTGETVLAEFPAEVVASHSLVVARILGGEEVEAESFLHLAGELLAIAKIARLLTRQVDYINEAKVCWKEALGAFEACAAQWARLSNAGEPVETHRRLLEQLRAQVADELEIYTLSLSDRLRDRHLAYGRDEFLSSRGRDDKTNRWGRRAE